jgi:hypothetical protein
MVFTVSQLSMEHKGVFEQRLVGNSNSLISAISWREQGNFQWDDDEVCFLLVINHYQKVDLVTSQKCAIISFFS